MVAVTAGGPDTGPRRMPVLKEEAGGGYGSLEEEEDMMALGDDQDDDQDEVMRPAADHDPDGRGRQDGPKKPALERYRELVLKYPQVASTVESAARTTSYFLPGRFDNSEEVSELVYSLSRLATLLNDSIIRKSVISKAPAPAASAKKYDRVYSGLQYWLTVIEHVQVVAEMISLRFGDRTRWVYVAAMEAARASARGLLLFKYGSTLLPSPPYDAGGIDRTTVTCPNPGCGVVLTGGMCDACENGDFDSSFQKGSFDCEECGASTMITDVIAGASDADGPGARPKVSIGRRTGRMLRRNMKSALGRSALGSGADECAACRGQRTRIAKFVQSQQSFMPAVSTPLTAPKLFGELANISRPLLHLIAAYRWGMASWKPWIVGLLLEVGSLFAVRSEEDGISDAERDEVVRRGSLLMLYALRSPFYTRFTAKPLLAFLGRVKLRIPMLEVVVDSMVQYISVWQSLYYYGWAL